MAIIVTLAALMLIFYLCRRHTGPAHLAIIAGVSVFASFGTVFASFLHEKLFTDAPIELIENCIYLLLVLAFPLLLYAKSSPGGMFGLLRLVESVFLAIILTSLIAGPLAYFFSFDSLSTEIYGYIKTVEGPIMLAGIISAYIDILFYRK